MKVVGLLRVNKIVELIGYDCSEANYVPDFHTMKQELGWTTIKNQEENQPLTKGGDKVDEETLDEKVKKA